MIHTKRLNSRQYLLGYNEFDLRNIAIEHGESAYRGRQLYNWLYVRRVKDFNDMTDVSKDFRKILSEVCEISPLSLISDKSSNDGGRKFVFSLPDNNRIESVLIPDEERLTACLSTQVGCLIGCRFCATGKIGFIRNLSTSEIVSQFIAMEDIAGRRITNVVMMGMGEPLLNITRVLNASELLTDPAGIGLSHRRLNISTVGWLPGIEAMLSVRKQFKLTISLNGTTDEQRKYLMPLSARFPLREILKSAKRYTEATRYRITFSYLLLKGINDSSEDISRLISLVKGIPCKINLMEYNEIGGEFQRSARDTTDIFQDKLRSAGLTVILRRSRGEEVGAACGQLVGEYRPGSGFLPSVIPAKAGIQK
jgi:23S rRNA (adenine2503-C2)-methyltransferase